MTGWAWRLARHHLAGELPVRWAHVRGTARQAARIGSRVVSGDELGLLVAAAVLHDIGYARPLLDTGFHPVDGARFLRRMSAPARLCGLVANHSAAAVAARLRGLSDAVAEFPDEETALRDALWYCDMTTGPTGSVMSFEARVADVRARHGPGSLNVRALDSGGHEARVGAVRRTERRLSTRPAEPPVGQLFTRAG